MMLYDYMEQLVKSPILCETCGTYEESTAAFPLYKLDHYINTLEERKKYKPGKFWADSSIVEILLPI